MSTDAIVDFKDAQTAWVVCNSESFNNTLFKEKFGIADLFKNSGEPYIVQTLL